MFSPAVKIDRSFVRGALQNASDAGIIRFVVTFARELGLRVIAEGVETPEQLALVKKPAAIRLGDISSAGPSRPALRAVLERSLAPRRRHIS